MNPIASSNLDITLRPRRQITLPAEVVEALGLQVGDRLQVSLSDEGVIVKPKKSLSLAALREIQAAFLNSGITEEELQKMGRKIRQKLSSSRYGKK
ncbi:AbrB/MazE/SpoVT family DNA-binding domain-containing protein [Candidatus Microgenomates bacterium]|nr:AbrB/MazE/SpoVT family DNA-binding domain-containing protein [Candidatus Microgenomates bacterium]